MLYSVELRAYQNSTVTLYRVNRDSVNMKRFQLIISGRPSDGESPLSAEVFSYPPTEQCILN